MAGESDLLCYLAEKGDLTRLQAELSRRVDAVDTPGSRGYTPLCAAARKNRVEAIRLLLDAGAKPETCSSVDGEQTALMLAIIQRQYAAAEVLARAAADANVRDTYGRTALHYACDSDNRLVVDILLSKGADPNIEDQDGTSPILIAHMESHRELESALQAVGGQVDPDRLNRARLKANFDRHGFQS